MNIGCRIVLDAKRTDLTPFEDFKGIPVSNVDDCMNRSAAMHAAIRPLNRHVLFGSALTIKVPAGDNLMFHRAMDMVKTGDVIVIDAGGETNRAIFGELMLTYCVKLGLAGIVVDGSVRDSEELSSMPIPVYARGISPNGPWKNGPGEINTTITCGGQIVHPGDLLLGDQDGIIVIKPEEAERLLTTAKTIVKKEAEILKNILERKTYIRPWVDQKLDELNCEYFYSER